MLVLERQCVDLQHLWEYNVYNGKSFCTNYCKPTSEVIKKNLLLRCSQWERGWQTLVVSSSPHPRSPSSASQSRQEWEWAQSQSICVCKCMCVCVRGCGCVCVRGCVHVCGWVGVEILTPDKGHLLLWRESKPSNRYPCQSLCAGEIKSMASLKYFHAV